MSSARVLVCVADPGRREALALALKSKGFVPAAVATPREAVVALARATIVVAVVDWRGGGSAPLLAELGRRTEVPTFIYGDLSADERRQVAALHPRAYPQDSSWGVPALLDRISKVVGKQVGDLALRDGMVAHLPTGKPCPYPVLARLLAAYPNSVLLDERGAKMKIFRARQWLVVVGSASEIETSRRLGLYRLATVVADEPRQAA